MNIIGKVRMTMNSMSLIHEAAQHLSWSSIHRKDNEASPEGSLPKHGKSGEVELECFP
jgi:hypothetical protein